MKRETIVGKRLASLDAFRGITIAAMILVNNPGSWKNVYAPLRHAEWHGWTPTDLVFPFFVFIVGVSLTFSLARVQKPDVPERKVFIKILKRSFILFFLGIMLHLVPFFDFLHLRIPGVLQRIALCYLFSSLIYLKFKWKGRIVCVFSFLLAYWMLLKWIPVPGYGAGVLEYERNLCGYIDRLLLGGHLYRPDFDPEGILSTLPAVATALLGTLAGDWLRSPEKVFHKLGGLLAAGVFLLTAGLLLHPIFPVNKQLWTSSFVLLTAGMALLILGLCYWLIDGRGIKKWALSFIILGTNAITAYVGSSLMAKMLGLIKFTQSGRQLSLKTFIYENLFASWMGNEIGSLAFAICFVCIWILLMLPLYKNRVFIKV